MPRLEFPGFCHKMQNIRVISANTAETWQQFLQRWQHNEQFRGKLEPRVIINEPDARDTVFTVVSTGNLPHRTAA